MEYSCRIPLSNPKRPDETYPLQAPAGVCLSAGTTFCIWCRQGDYPEQLEGATLYGLTATLKGEINIQNGQIVQSNFDDYLGSSQGHSGN